MCKNFSYQEKKKDMVSITAKVKYMKVRGGPNPFLFAAVITAAANKICEYNLQLKREQNIRG